MRPAKLAMEERRKRENLIKIEEEYHGKQIPTVSENGNQGKFVFCPDIGYTQLQKLRFGRFSFNGVNPDIEKLMNEESKSRKRQYDPDYQSDDEKDILDEELAGSAFARKLKKPKEDVLQIYTEETTETLAEENVKRIIEAEDGEIVDDDGNSSPKYVTRSSRGKYHPYKKSKKRR